MLFGLSLWWHRRMPLRLHYTDYHVHSSATNDQWYCTDEDVKGQVTKWYEGRYMARGYKFDHRTYWAYIYAI